MSDQEELIRELTDALADCISQACDPKCVGHFHDQGLGAYSHALTLLVRMGRVTLTDAYNYDWVNTNE